MLQVAIVGGGMAGSILALFLEKHGVTSAVFEMRSENYRQGGNIALAPNALRVMDHIGIYNKLKAFGYNYEELTLTNGAGEVLGKFLNGSQRVYNFPALRIHRNILRDELIKEINRKGIPIYYKKKCIGMKEESERSATVLFDDGQTIEAEFVVGTDGIHSSVRSFIAPHSQPNFSGLMGITGAIMADQLSRHLRDYGAHLPSMLYGALSSFAIMPASPDGRDVGYFAIFETEDRGRDGWQQLADRKDELKSMLSGRFLIEESGWPPLVKELCEKTPSATLASWPFFSVPHLDTWASPGKRVIIIGDAAHAIPPTGGQGAAMAFEDAETLAYVIADILSPVSSVSSQLNEVINKWQHHRMSRIDKVVEFTSRNGSLRKSTPRYYKQVAKEWFIWAALKWMGPEGGAKWMYSYNAENILGAIAS